MVSDCSSKINSDAQPLSHPQAADEPNWADISQALTNEEQAFKRTQADQGLLGKSFDWIKNNLGGSAQSDSASSRLWSNVLSSDNGSDAVQERIDHSKKDLSLALEPSNKGDGEYSRKLIAGYEVNQAGVSVENYQVSQKQGVQLLENILTFD